MPALIHQNQQRHLSAIWDALRQQPALTQVDRWLTVLFRGKKSYGKSDRRFYSESIFSIIRQAVVITYLHNLKGGDVFSEQSVELYKQTLPDPCDVWPILRNLTLPAIQQLTADIKHTKNLSPQVALLLNGVHPAYFAALEKRAQLSNWDTQQTTKFAEALAVRPPLWVRLNHPTKKDDVINDLLQNAFQYTEKNLGSITALELHGTKGVFELQSYKQGLFEIQDLASQKIGEALDVHPGMAIWDACAGGGGKTMLIASQLQGRGVVYASDNREYKLQDTKQRARRAGFTNVRLLPWDGTQLPGFPKEIQLRHGFHRVLVDVPCSSSGTYRRNPDAMLRHSLKNLDDLLSEQQTLLQSAAAGVRAGGQLVYSTCSWLPDENELQIQKFLAKNPNFQLQQQSVVGSPQDNSDTMFFASLLKDKK